MPDENTQNGQVVFTIRRQTLRVGLILEDIQRAIDHEHFEGLRETLFSNFSLFVACTENITVISDKPDESLSGLLMFWDKVQDCSSDGYPALWELFLDTLDITIQNAWWDAYADANNRALHADPELAPPDELTKEQKDNPLSKSGAKTSGKKRVKR